MIKITLQITLNETFINMTLADSTIQLVLINIHKNITSFTLMHAAQIYTCMYTI